MAPRGLLNGPTQLYSHSFRFFMHITKHSFTGHSSYDHSRTIHELSPRSFLYVAYSSHSLQTTSYLITHSTMLVSSHVCNPCTFVDTVAMTLQ